MASRHEPPQPQALWRFQWRRVPGAEAANDADLLKRCASLYSGNYGLWGKGGPRPGAPVTRRPEDIAKLLEPEESFLAIAELPDGELAGYCVAVFAELEEKGRVAWVSQLVVGEAYRNARVATSLLYSIWQFSDNYACGLVTSNPFAVRALESATRRGCQLGMIRRRGPGVLEALSEKIPYLPATLQTEDELARPVVDTDFHVSHEQIARMREKAARGARPWALGDIDEGEEWFACTFGDQAPAQLSAQHLQEILIGADRVWIDAFARMTLDQAHQWRQHTDIEVDFLEEQLGPAIECARILDLGCGDGRHSVELARRGYNVLGVDVVPALIERASEAARSVEGASFAIADARDSLPGEFDLVLMLYDILGASGNVDDDRRVLNNAISALRPGGHLVLSVMNARLLDGRIPKEQLPENDEEFVRALEALPPSNTMESTGDIFDPKLLLHYGGVYYRKEQFIRLKGYLPSEHIVRDLRYRPASLRALLEGAGLKVLELRPVQAGHWREGLRADNQRAKELLAVASKPQP